MENKNILITGASGTIGFEIIRGLHEIHSGHQIFAGVNRVEKAQKLLAKFKNLQYRYLNFEDVETFEAALKNIEIVFLLRPPQLADVPKYFSPFTRKMKEMGISKVVFLSVQGVEKQKSIPHYKLEKLIENEGFDFVFLRPGYFMQNLTSTLIHEIKTDNKIFIPSGKLKLNWVDARDIGLVGAHVLNDFEKHKNKSLEITGSEFTGFAKVARIISNVTGRKINYESPKLIEFYREKRKLGHSKQMILVMIMLHFFPRFNKNVPRLTQTVEQFTGEEPGTIKEFVEREKAKFH